MKQLVSKLLALALILILSATAWAFIDTGDLSAAEQAALTALSSQGVIEGYPDGSFRPAEQVTRAEFAKMLCLYAGQDELRTATVTFSDVAPAAWYYGWVSRAAEQGWINGYPGGEYRPQSPVTQQDIATMLVRLSGADTTGFNWPQDYIAAAEAAGAFKNINFAATTAASRIITCQMLYNTLPLMTEQTPPEQVAPLLENTTVRGIVTELGAGSITVKDNLGKSASYTVSGKLPDKLILGSYVELTINGGAALQVEQSVIAKKSAVYWDVALDGKSALIDDKKYDLTEMEIYAVTYTLNKPYSSETFTGGGPIDRDLLALGGRLAAEYGVLVEGAEGALPVAYLVNASVSIVGGRLDVVDGGFANARGSGLHFLGRETGLAMDSSLSVPGEGQFIHYNIKNGLISSCTVLFDINSGDFYETATALKNAGADDPYAWIDGNGRPDPAFAGNILQDPLPLIISSSQGTLQLGRSEGSSSHYFLAPGCLVYEVKNGKVEQGSRSSLQKGQEVLALTSRNSDIGYIFCFL